MTFQEELEQEKNPAIIKIANYLLSREDIQENLAKANKSLKQMWDYIVGEAKKKAVSGCSCIDDETVYGMAVHYYDEDNIEVDTDATKKLRTVMSDETVKPKKKSAGKKKVNHDKQLSLFGDLL